LPTTLSKDPKNVRNLSRAADWLVSALACPKEERGKRGRGREGRNRTKEKDVHLKPVKGPFFDSRPLGYAPF